MGELCIDLGDDLQGLFKVFSKQFKFTENLELLDKKLCDCKNELQHYESSPYQSK